MTTFLVFFFTDPGRVCGVGVGVVCDSVVGVGVCVGVVGVGISISDVGAAGVGGAGVGVDGVHHRSSSLPPN